MVSHSTSEKHVPKLPDAKHDPVLDISEHIFDQKPSETCRPWTSKWHSKPALFVYIALFTALWISLIALWISADKRHGLSLTLSSNHYAWTYGPTALLVIVVSIWRQVDYYCKAIQPWSIMSRGPCAASRSILLDYVSPIQPSSLIKAIRYQHWPVVFSIVGFITLKLVVLSSTALLVATSTRLTANFTVEFPSEFNGSRVWSEVVVGPIPAGNVSWSSGIGNVSSDSTLAFREILKGRLAQPPNTRADAVFQSFEPVDVSKGLFSITSDVDVLVPNVTCEIGTASTKGDLGTYNMTSNSSEWMALDVLMAVHSPTCSLEATNASAEIKAIFCVGRDCPSWLFSYSITRVGCSTIISSNETVLEQYTDIHDFRFAVMAVNITSDPSQSNFGAPQLQAAAVAICKMDYGMHLAPLTQDLENDRSELPHSLGQSKGHLNDLPQTYFSELVIADLCAAPNVDEFNWENKSLVPTFNNVHGTGTDAFFALMLLTEKLQVLEEHVKVFLDPKKMAMAAKTVFTGIAVQFARRNILRSPDADRVESARGTYLEDRLHLRMPSLWLMVAGLIFMAIATFGILMTGQYGVLPRDPTSLAFHASVLSASPALCTMLKGCGSVSSRQLHTVLQYCRFEMYLDSRSFHIKSSGSETPLGLPPADKRWIPTAARLPVASGMLLVPPLAVALLEMLSRISNHNNGLISVEGANYITSGAIYATTLVLLLIATLFNNFEFTALTFAPFNSLRSGFSSAKGTLLGHPLGQPAPTAFIRMTYNRHFGAALITFAATIGSVLPIIASGLWIVDGSARFEWAAKGSIVSTWDVSWLNSSKAASNAASLLDRIDRDLGETSPQTWDGLVFPNLDATLDDTSLPLRQLPSSSSLNYSFVVPALRAELVCDVVPMENLFVTYTPAGFNETDSGTWIFTALVNAPTACFKNSTGNPVGMRISQGRPDWDFAGLSGWWGRLLAIDELAPFDDYVQEPYFLENFSLPKSKEDDNSCPSFGVYFGYSSNESPKAWNDSSILQNITALACYQKLQELEATTIYAANISATKFDDQEPLSVEVRKNPIRYLRNETANSETFSYQILRSLNSLAKFPDQLSTENYSTDSFFNHMFHTNSNISWEDLFGIENIPKLIEVVAARYRKYMSIVIDANFREPLNGADSASAPSTNGTAIGYISRLKINAASKLALQIMLTIMTILGGLAFWLLDLRNTLPREPCSIASTMALFADSKMCSREYMPEGAEWLSTQQLELLWQGQKFRLGWWNVSEDDSRAAEYQATRSRNSAHSSGSTQTLDNLVLDEVIICPHGNQSLGDQAVQHQRLLVDQEDGSQINKDSVGVETRLVLEGKPLLTSTKYLPPGSDISTCVVSSHEGENGTQSQRRRFGIDIVTPAVTNDGGWRRRFRRGKADGSEEQLR